MPSLLCIDIGNTHTHLGLVDAAGPVQDQADLPTPRIDHPDDGLPARIAALRAAGHPVAGLAFCSVVPGATHLLLRVADALRVQPWQLTHERNLGIPITYPRPAEIGQDRLANAAAAHALHGSPAVVIDLGTAVTFDIVTRAGGYEGGIITPGPALVTRYLHERTAQLPLVEDLSGPVPSAIGRSTVEAIRIGAILGFAGMMQGLLDAVLAELEKRGEPTPVVIASGGAARAVTGRLRQPVIDVPDLALRGLAAARALNR